MQYNKTQSYEGRYRFWEFAVSVYMVWCAMQWLLLVGLGLSLGVEVGWLFLCRKMSIFQNSLEEEFFVAVWLMYVDVEHPEPVDTLKIQLYHIISAGRCGSPFHAFACALNFRTTSFFSQGFEWVLVYPGVQKSISGYRSGYRSGVCLVGPGNSDNQTCAVQEHASTTFGAIGAAERFFVLLCAQVYNLTYVYYSSIRLRYRFWEFTVSVSMLSRHKHQQRPHMNGFLHEPFCLLLISFLANCKQYANSSPGACFSSWNHSLGKAFSLAQTLFWVSDIPGACEQSNRRFACHVRLGGWLRWTRHCSIPLTGIRSIEKFCVSVDSRESKNPCQARQLHSHALGSCCMQDCLTRNATRCVLQPCMSPSHLKTSDIVCYIH